MKTKFRSGVGIGIGYQVSDACNFFPIKYQLCGIRYLISRYKVSNSEVTSSIVYPIPKKISDT